MTSPTPPENPEPYMPRESAHYPAAYIEILQKRLLAYQKAFNKVDDLMEYRSMNKAQFDKIAADLTEDLK